ncbi:MAG: helix-turn-helix domain-containing protein [Nannocystaceae bacterium]
MIKKDEALLNVADNLSRIMESRGIGVRELARHSENDPMTVSRLVRKIHMPSADSLYRIAQYLNIKLDALFATPRKKNKKKSA